MRLTADLIENANVYVNPLHQYEIDLRASKIPRIENLGITQDQFESIDLSDNDIIKLENFPVMLRLRTLLLSNNRISRIATETVPTPGEALPGLESLVLTNNRFTILPELDALAQFKSLKYLSLLGNEVTKRKNYRLYVIHLMPNLKVLDFVRVKSKDRKAAESLFQSEEGKALQSEARTFVPGELERRGPRAPTTEQIAKIQAAIEAATSFEEVSRLEAILSSGMLPENLDELLNPKTAQLQAGAPGTTDSVAMQI